MTLSIHHIAINAQSPDDLSALYARAVGFKELETPGPVRWLAGPNAFVALHQASRPLGADDLNRSVADQGIGHFCIQSGDGPATWQALTSAGIAFNAGMTSLGGDYLYAYGRDPEANLIEVEGLTNGASPGSPWIAHVALVSANIERLAAFYTRLIGRAPHDGGRFKNPAFKTITGLDDVDVSAKWLMTDNIIFEMWQYHNPETRPAEPPPRGAPGYRHVGFCCTDLDAEVSRMAGLGIVLGETEGPARSRLFSGSDPDGNAFILFQALSTGEPLSLDALPRPDIVADQHRDILSVSVPQEWPRAGEERGTAR
jgi:catechol 2,3-dioxygenase-like lactoylglutathione lyase family enzyme